MQEVAGSNPAVDCRSTIPTLSLPTFAKRNLVVLLFAQAPRLAVLSEGLSENKMVCARVLLRRPFVVRSFC